MRQSLRNIATTVFLTIVGTILLAVVAEFFIEVARDKGAFEDAGGQWDHAMGVILDTVTSGLVLYPVTMLGGFVAGLWADRWLKRAEEGGRESSNVSWDWDFLNHEVAAAQVLVINNITINESFPDCEWTIWHDTSNIVLSLLVYLAERNAISPSVFLLRDAGIKDFLEWSHDFLSAIAPSVRAQSPFGVTHFGKIASDAYTSKKASRETGPEHQPHPST